MRLPVHPAGSQHARRSADSRLVSVSWSRFPSWPHGHLRLYMIAVDTNVLVRLLTDDEPEQAAAARRLFASEPIWIAKTVLLETGWVLRSLYGFDESAIRNAFAKLLGLKKVRAEGESSVAAALAIAAHGIELADAMHGRQGLTPSTPATPQPDEARP